ncbi:MAG: contractile injection system protein, VgrG/Pvc8 family [Proteobacteria bacterium]|nr:contractile injection system protein, VgrG/Pvc8 family [Pseudomonadota bacterium]
MGAASYPRALWRLAIADKDLTIDLAPRLMQLTLTDNPGLEADQLDLTLSDADGLLDIPARGVRLSLALGRSDMGLLDKGSYTVDEVEHSGTPDQLTIRAHSADLRESLLTKKERSWHGTTLGAIVRKIAQEHKLKPAISPELEKAEVKHLDQQSESDASFLTRLALTYDAMATVKDSVLIFYAIGRGKTINGEPLPEVTVTRASGDRHRFSVSDREGCAGVSANYYDKQAGKQGTVTIREQDLKKGQQKDNVGGNAQAEGGKLKVLRHTYASRKNAARAAVSALKKALRGASTFSLSLALGRPDIVTELAATVSGWKPAIDGTRWRVAKVTHQLSGSGMTTDLELELRTAEPGEAGNDDDENEDGHDDSEGD